MKNFKFLIKGKKYDVNVLSLDGNVARLKVNDEDYMVEIERNVKAKQDTYCCKVISKGASQGN